MRIVPFLVVTTLLVGLSTSAEAALIYGTIKAGAAPLANHDLALACGQKSYEGKTDKRGSYSIHPGEQGRCRLSITYDGRRLEYTVYSQVRPARYDLVVVRGADGGFTLRRK